MKVPRRLRPLDGWRRFFGEVGIIILGVMVALGLGAIATEIGWRRDVAEARAALAFEFGDGIGQGQLIVRVTPCVEQRLDQLTRIVADAGRSGRLPPVGPIGTPPWHTWDSGVWNSAVASQTASHFPRDEAGGIVGFYNFLSILRDNTSRELDLWTRLYSLVGPGRTFTAEEARQVDATIGEARLTHRLMARAAIRAEQLASAYRLGYDKDTARIYTRKPNTAQPICLPIPARAPATYGQAPFEGVIEFARATPLTRPDSDRR